jgi:hypothetical protein
MAWGKYGAMGMLVAVVLWTAAPLLACVPGLHAKSKPDCCVAMSMPDCGDSMNGACCEFAPTHTSATTVSVYAPEHEQLSALMVRSLYLPVLNDATVGRPRMHEAAPPDPSPGGLSILRI